MSSLPSGTVTFLFTDIEGSTTLAQQYPDQWETLRQRHHVILQSAMDAHNGYVFQIIGDAFCVAFPTPRDGLSAAVIAQRNLHNDAWGAIPIKVRMGLHTGEAELQDSGDYRGYLAMSRVQRIMSAGHGGQILISSATQELVRDHLPNDVSLRDMGERRLKNLIRSEHIYQLVIANVPSEFAPLKTFEIYRHNLPSQTTSFIGREKEMTEVKQALAEHRLVTLTGSGGAGKSRLSLQVAAVSLDLFPDGVWFVELAPLSDPDLIPQKILTAAEIQNQQGHTAQEVLIDFLREKTSLLVLDNCEHLIEACARLVETLLNAAPNLKILASSREALGVRGEQAWRVPSLSAPDIKRLPPIEQLSKYEAVRLFIDRALLVQPHFVVTNENAPAVAQICHRLDGIPLAIELAAARLRLLSAQQIAARLDDRFRLLIAGTRTALPRQQTLRALLDWSYELLSKSERNLLRRLAVFSGGWTLEAAEQVCSDENLTADDVLDVLDHLVDKSLVVVEVGQDQETRYRYMETIRQYAREKLFECGESAANRTRHLAYFLKWVRKMEPDLRGLRQVELLDHIESEIDNLRAALEWSQDSNPGSGLQIASMMKWFWHLCVLFEEGADWLENILVSSQKIGTEIEPVLKARSLSVLAWLSFWSGNIQTAMTSLNESLQLCEKNQGSMADLITADNLYLAGGSALSSGDLSQAKLLAEKGLGLYQAWGNIFGVAEISGLLFAIALSSGDLETASRWNEASIVIRKELGDKDGLAFDLTTGAVIPLSQRDYESTKRRLKAAVDACKETRNESILGVALGYSGMTCLFEDNMEQALDYFSQLVTLAYEKSNALLKTFGIYYLALFLAKQNQYRASIQLNGAMEGLRTYPTVLFYENPIFHDTRQQSLLEAREALGETNFEAAYAAGRAMTLDQAITFALTDSDH
jgi:predicted ATPase/class 3 adenylate cyclase